MYYLILFMLQTFFILLGICLVFYVLWSLIHRLLARLTDSGKPYRAVTIVHWVLLGLIALLSLADFAIYVAYLVQVVENSDLSLGTHWIRFEASIYIIFWLLSLEILAWVIFIMVKGGSNRFVSKVRELV